MEANKTFFNSRDLVGYAEIAAYFETSIPAVRLWQTRGMFRHPEYYACNKAVWNKSVLTELEEFFKAREKRKGRGKK